VKACASTDRRVKRCGYLGLMFIENPKHGLLMTNTILKDLRHESTCGDALIFLSNRGDAGNMTPEMAGEIKSYTETESSHARCIVAEHRLRGESQFSLTSGNDVALLTKLQILLDSASVRFHL